MDFLKSIWAKIIGVLGVAIIGLLYILDLKNRELNALKAKARLATTEKEVEVLETQWSMLNWKEQNEVMSASSQAVDPMTGEAKFNFLVYRDAIIKRCLKSWNLTVDDQPVPVTPDAIDQLPGPVIINIYQKFEKYLEFSEEELGN